MTFRSSIAILFFYLISVSVCGQNSKEHNFTRDELRADVDYLQLKLESNHPNLYLYTAKPSIDLLFDSLKRSIQGPMSELEFYKHITIISSVIKDGHTIILPAKSTMDQHNKISKFFPYKLIILGGKLYVDMVCTTDSTILPAAEILKINNLASAEIIEQLMKRQVRDGNNLSYPTWILSNFFRGYYSFIFGHPEEFKIEYMQHETIRTSIIRGLPNDSIAYYRKLRYPNRTNEKRPGEGISIKFSAENKYAILTIKDFHDDILRKEYRQNFKEVISEYFQELNNKAVSNLILDIRDNQGGDIPNGVKLLSYLIDKPFTILQSYYEVDGSGNSYTLKKTTGQSLGIHKPAENVFKGKLFILINGGSFSNSGIVAACLKRNGRGVFIGEETGGSNKILAGYSKDYKLPNTGIQLEIPARQFLLDDVIQLTGHGTMPDYPVQPTLTINDVVLKVAVDMILK
ncbi:S41 family peptidase [soil metagenome]